MDFDYNQIIEALLKLVLVTISTLLIPWLVQKLKDEKYKKLLSYIDTFVNAAEQIFSRDDTEEKKNYVLNGLASLGYNIDEITEDQIEAAVIKLHNLLSTGLYRDDSLSAYDILSSYMDNYDDDDYSNTCDEDVD